MLRHIVLFRFHDYYSAEVRKEISNTAAGLLNSLKDKIPEIVKLSAVSFSCNDRDGYDLILDAEFESDTDLLKYQVHPEHIAVAQYIHIHRQQRAVADYEF